MSCPDCNGTGIIGDGYPCPTCQSATTPKPEAQAKIQAAIEGIVRHIIMRWALASINEEAPCDCYWCLHFQQDIIPSSLRAAPTAAHLV